MTRECQEKVSTGPKLERDEVFNEAAAGDGDETVKLAFQIRRIEKWERQEAKRGRRAIAGIQIPESGGAGLS